MSKERKTYKRGLLVFHKGLILVFAPLLIQAVLIVSLALVLLQLDAESIKESRYRRCAAIGAHLVVLADEAAIDVIAWFHAGNPEVMKLYDNAIAALKKEEKQLHLLSRDDPLSGKSAADLMNSIDKLTGLLDKVAGLAKQQRLFDMALVIPHIDQEFKASRNTHIEHIGAVTNTQEKIAEESTVRQDQLSRYQNRIIVYGIIANAVLALVLFVFFKRSISDRLKVVRNNTICLAENRPLERELSGADEIYQLDQAFHRMNAELKAAMERERSLFNNASDVICVLDERWVFERINPACNRHWGLEPEKLIGKSVLQIVEESKADKAISLFESAKSGGKHSTFELILQKCGGPALESLWSTYWSDEEHLLYCVVHDISERKHTERIKQSYLKMISSDLRIPLASIAAAAERLAGPLAEHLSAKALERIKTVRANLSRLLLLVNDLLDMAALDSGTLELTRETVEVEPLLTRSCHDLDGLAQKSKIRFKVECSAGRCYLDPNRIMQVIVNLASNAVKFSPEGAEVLLKAFPNGQFLEVNVIDHGRGVPANHKSAIFEKFKQVEASDGKRSAGTGLGLPICKDIIEKHGGQIGVESQVGQGSTFWFRLPLKPSEAAGMVPAKTQEEEEQDGRVQHAPALAAGVAGDTVVPCADAKVVPCADAVGACCTRPPGSREGAPGRKASLTLTQKGILLIMLPLAVELIFVMSILGVIAQVNAGRQEELRQRQIAADAYSILNCYFKMIVLTSPASQEEYWLGYDQCCTTEQQARAHLRTLLKNDASALHHFLREEKVSTRFDELIERGRRIISENGYSNKHFDKVRPDKIVLIATCYAVSRRLLALIDDVEKKQSVTPLQQSQLRKQQSVILLAGLSANILLSLLLAQFFSKNITTRLATLADNTVRLATNHALNPPIPGSDEIAELDRAFHATAAKLAEARRKERAVFDNSRDLITALDPQLRFISINPAGERLLGCSAEELNRVTLCELIDRDERESLEQKLSKESLITASSSCETRIMRNDGSCAYLLWSLSRPENEANIYCVAHDISDRKQLEQLKQEFLAVVSHDLRNPLGSVIGFITLIKAGALGETGTPAIPSLDLITEEADRLLSLINDLLDLEKLEARSMDMALQPQSAGMIAYRAFESIQARFAEFTLQMAETNVEEELSCDPERLTQAFSNIFTYICRRYRQDNRAGADKAIIGLSFRRDGKRLNFEITDPGKPYSPKEQEQLFDRFKASEQSALPTAGLALPIARRIIEAHGGSLSFEMKSDCPVFSISLG